ncbi:hypothetical protein KNO15_21615 [Leifsonia shinshuensis]|uniref:hypothetical protein n=1 Tax=Leifsonia shinshuensis TaxID=150026 RepID=UPI001F5071A0|nr:hypothetical protein [Leifsonia shinshuensis]MCI0159307.1 hypothetical protein [Leifsonia shinshuensis]
MSDQDDGVIDAVDEIAAAIGPDITYVAPLDEKHFDPLSALFVFGGILLYRFLTGAGKEIEERSEKLGQRAAARLLDSVTTLFRRHEDDSEERVAGLITGTLEREDLSVASVLEVADVVSAELVAALAETGMPMLRAEGLTSRVRAAALEVLAEREG